MKAQLIILTHFSARYPKMPSLNDSFRSHTAFAFDLMRVRHAPTLVTHCVETIKRLPSQVSLNDLNRVVQLVPAVDLVFKETDSDQEASDPRRIITL